MSFNLNENNIHNEESVLLFGDKLDDVNHIKQMILDQGVNYSIDTETVKDSLYSILKTCNHSVLLFFDFERENNLNEVEMFIKSANPDVNLIFLDYSREQILEYDDLPLFNELIHKIITWVEKLTHKKTQSEFYSLKLSSKDMPKENTTIVNIVFDKTHEKELTHNELLNEIKRLKIIFDLAPEGIAILNMRGYITQVNKAWLELTGYDYNEIVGKHLLTTGIIRNEDILKIGRAFTAVIRGQPLESFEFKGYKKDGTWRIGESRSRLLNLGFFKKEIVLMTHDVTDRYNREMKLRNALKNLEETNRELDDYTYAVSHDLKAPLRTIKSFGTFLLEDYSDGIDEEGRMYLRRMMKATTHMKDLIEDLLTLSRVGRMDIEDEFVDVNTILDLIRLDLSSQLEETGGEILATNIPTIKVQRIWIRQLLFNLISNGLKFTKSETPKVWVNCFESPIEYSFSVRDNGIGIEEKYQDKIFKIFERLHKPEEYSGTGAGLTICKKIVDTLGGKIWIESKLGNGSTFFFTIPKVTYDPLTTNLGEAFTIADIPNGDM